MENISDADLDMIIKGLDNNGVESAVVPAQLQEPVNNTIIVSSQPKPFYHGMMKADAEMLQETAMRIRDRHRRNIIETGNDLLAIQKRLPKLFDAWLKAEFPSSVRSAWNYMRVAEQFKSTPKVIDVLPVATVYRLAAKGTPDPLRQAIVKEIEAGRLVTKEDVERRIKDAKSADKTTNKPSPASKGNLAPALRKSQEDAAKDAVALLKKELGENYAKLLELVEKTSDSMLRWAMGVKSRA